MPEDPVASRYLVSLDASLKHDDLLAQGEVLGNQVDRGRRHCSEEHIDRPQHRPLLAESGAQSDIMVLAERLKE